MSPSRIFPEETYRKYVRPVLLIYPIVMLPFLSIGISDIRQEMLLAEFLRNFDPRSYLLPVACDEKRGALGTDYVQGYNRVSGRGDRVIKACWYTLATYKRRFPERARGSDSALIDRSFETLSIRKQRPSIGEPVLTVGFAALTLAFLTMAAVMGFREWQDSRKKS